ncbi:bifunctional acetaldehyde-CoA/alcohol dehydrogenase [Haematococcus lacustris]
MNMQMRHASTLGKQQVVSFVSPRVQIRPRYVVAGAAPAIATVNERTATPEVEAMRARAASDMNWFRVPPKVYFKGGSLEVALAELNGLRRAFIVTDKKLFDMDYANRVSSILDTMHIQSQVFYQVSSDPTSESVLAGVKELRDFKPDVIIAVGGGSPIDAAKAMRYMHERPGQSLSELAMSCTGSGQRSREQEAGAGSVPIICIPTTSGTGSEVTPFATITDPATARKYTLADYALTPSMAVVDPQLVINLPAQQTAYGGMCTIAHALESYISVFASDYSRGLSKHALTMVSRYAARAYQRGNSDMHAREKMHNAATVAGMAAANTFLGINHGLASELASTFQVNTGLAKGLLILPVMRLMLRDRGVMEALAELAQHLKLGGSTQQEQAQAVLTWVAQCKADMNIPTSIQSVLGANKGAVFMAQTQAMSMGALKDAHAIASPVQATMQELEDLLHQAWVGE